MWVTSSTSTAKTPTAIALGNFDGVHLGHQQVIEPILQRSDRQPQDLAVGDLALNPATATVRGYSHLLSEFANHENSVSATASAPPSRPPHATVLTFFPHPREFFSRQSRPLLTPLDEKALQLKRMGVEQLILLPFNHQLAELSPEAFVEDVLLQQLQAQQISVGVDFRFGRQRAGTAEKLRAIAARQGVPVEIVSLKKLAGERISSSSIRQALLAGDLFRVRKLLGRPYTLTGRVVTGQKLGRTIGFPTANLKLPADKFLPRQGVYAVRVYLRGHDLATRPLLGVMNLGCRPTVDGQQQTIEVHILEWSGDLYEQNLTVSLEAFLRPEQKFDALDSLKEQIQADCQAALTVLSNRDRR
ncbi:bifunctional riboflavin kinase/FAD synthetase [Sphaerothrix gracilis]|uniref:bifunctional riboflavin kinase/FAD synthetase n=1 Tax=Sphaerothrix gracilis TaxID=3151835 RepID=UPI0031FD91EE